MPRFHRQRPRTRTLTSVPRIRLSVLGGCGLLGFGRRACSMAVGAVRVVTSAGRVSPRRRNGSSLHLLLVSGRGTRESILCKISTRELCPECSILHRGNPGFKLEEGESLRGERAVRPGSCRTLRALRSGIPGTSSKHISVTLSLTAPHPCVKRESFSRAVEGLRT